MSKLYYNFLKVYDYLFINKMSKSKFCKECGISLPKFNKVLDNITPVDFQVLNKISNYTKIEVSDLIIYEL